MKKCKCGKEAKFVVPAHLCEECWAEWWASGVNPENLEQETKEVLESMRKHESIIRTKNPNIFGEYIRDLTFKKENERDFGCYSTFEVELGFKDIDPKSPPGKKILDLLVGEYNTYYGIKHEVEQQNIDFVVGAGRMVTDGGLIAAWYWDGDGVLLVGCHDKFAINTDCKKDYGWRWVRK